jgi:hypothetical protein
MLIRSSKPLPLAEQADHLRIRLRPGGTQVALAEQMDLTRKNTPLQIEFQYGLQV